MEDLKDRALMESVRQHLMEDDRLGGQSLEVVSSGGFIQVIGRVDTEEQKELALELAKGVMGVRDVEDRIVVRDDSGDE